MPLHESYAFFYKEFTLLPVLSYICYRESKMSFISSKKKLSYKSAAHLQDGIHKVSEFSLSDVEVNNFLLVNDGSILLILPVYDE